MTDRDISDAIGEWPFDAARVQARLLRARGDKLFIQVRVDMGLLQMERDGRPDGTTPDGYPSILDRYRAIVGRAVEMDDPPESLAIPPEDFPEIDRELLQYHHRRMALFSLADYARAARDAEHGLELLLLIQAHAGDRDYVRMHEKSIPFILMERSRARALVSLRQKDPGGAVMHVEEGTRLIREHLSGASYEAGAQTVKEIAYLKRWAQRLRRAHGLEPPLERQLEDAVEREDYEEAARLRDVIRRKDPE